MFGVKVKHNKALHWTQILLRFICASELGRYVSDKVGYKPCRNMNAGACKESEAIEKARRAYKNFVTDLEKAKCRSRNNRIGLEKSYFRKSRFSECGAGPVLLFCQGRCFSR